MKLRVDKEADALHFSLNDGPVAESEEVRPGVVLDFDEQGQVVGVEFLGIRSRIGDQNLTSVHFEST